MMTSDLISKVHKLPMQVLSLAMTLCYDENGHSFLEENPFNDFLFETMDEDEKS